MKSSEMILSAATLFGGLMAGFFFAYSFSVNWGLKRLDNTAYLSAMQNINKEVLNPIFFTCFFGALMLIPIATIQQLRENRTTFVFLLIAALSYSIGVFGITGFKNVPLNQKLATFNISTATNASLQQMRNTFEKPWVFWNNIRMTASLITLFCLIAAWIAIKNK